MARQRGDTQTMSLLTGHEPPHEPPRLSVNYDKAAPVQATSVDQTIARAVSVTLKDDGRPRSEIAEAMTDYLGTDVTENMLNAYASAARDSHRISLERAIALVAVTGDARLIGKLLEGLGWAVIEQQYMGAVRAAYARKQRKHWAAIEEREDRSWSI
jgi:hypothetical protein